MGQKTDAAVAALTASVAGMDTKLDGATAWIKGEPDRTAAAVADALAAAGTDDATQAALIDAARTDMEGKVNAAVSAINTAPGGGEAPNASDSGNAGATDTVTSGAGNDTVTGTSEGLTPNEATTSADGVTPGAEPQPATDTLTGGAEGDTLPPA